jgi:hypothetical protein
MVEPTKKSRVYAILNKLPNIELKKLYRLVPDINQVSVRKYRMDFKNEHNKGNNKNITKTSKKKLKKVESPPSSSTTMETLPNKNHNFDPALMAMNDNELARHRLRMILVDSNTSTREVLDAVGKMTTYLDKSGNINMEESSEKEVMEQFRQKDTQILVNMLKKNSAEES